jgi:hypothetical protein
MTPNSWHPISTGAWGWFDESGTYRGRWQTESAFNEMVNRAGYGVQSAGTGIGTGYTSNAAKGAAIINDMKTVAVGSGTLATLRTLKGETLSVMERVKSFGVLRAIGDVALAATAFEVGLSIGGVVADVLFPAETEYVPPVSAYFTPAAAEPYEAGATLTISGITWPPMSAPGMVLEWEGHEPHLAPNTYDWGEGATNCKGEPREVFPGTKFLGGPAGMYLQTLGTTTLCGGSYPEPTRQEVEGTGVVPLEVTCLPGESGCSPKETKTGTAPTPENQPKVAEEMQKCMEGLLGCTMFPGWWWNHDPEAKSATHNYTGASGLDPNEPLTVHVPAIEPGGETYTHYDARLEEVGLKPEPVVVAESQIDPRVGPLDVVSVVPEGGTQVEGETKVRVRYNPETAPEGSEQVAEGGTPSPWAPPAIPSIDLSPFSTIGDPCSVFPFGVMCWVGTTLSSWSGEGTCPKISIPIGKTIGQEDELGVDTCKWEPAMEIIRPVLVVLCTLGLGLLFSGWAMSGGGGGDD